MVHFLNGLFGALLLLWELFIYSGYYPGYYTFSLSVGCLPAIPCKV